MERKKREAYSGSRYPDIREALNRRDLLKGLGLASGAVAVSTAAGCIPHVMGMIVDPEEDSYQISMPQHGVQTLTMEYQGTIDYHVVAVVRGHDLYMYLENECSNLLAVLDDVLSTHPIHDFEPGSDYTTIVEEITQTLADAYAGELGASTEDFYSVEFIVDYYDEEQEIDGDIADSK